MVYTHFKNFTKDGDVRFTDNRYRAYINGIVDCPATVGWRCNAGNSNEQIQRDNTPFGVNSYIGMETRIITAGTSFRSTYRVQIQDTISNSYLRIERFQNSGGTFATTLINGRINGVNLTTINITSVFPSNDTREIYIQRVSESIYRFIANTNVNNPNGTSNRVVYDIDIPELSNINWNRVAHFIGRGPSSSSTICGHLGISVVDNPSTPSIGGNPLFKAMLMH